MTEFADISVKPDWLPPANNKWREYERTALQIRRFAGVDILARLDPFKLAQSLGLKVINLDSIEGLSESSREHLTGSSHWSGGATKPLADGSRVIVINNRHSPARQSATLMEEICHTILGHEPSVILGGESGGRSYNRAVEEEAYAVGAAALVPFCALAELISKGDSVRNISRRFGVTTALVEYRLKVLGLWGMGAV